MTTYLPMPLSWHPMRLGLGLSNDHVRSSAIEKRIGKVLESWEGTPYSLKMSRRGEGTYCSAFVCHVLDELYFRTPTELPKIPDDISFHDWAGAVAGLKWFLRQFPSAERIEGQGEVEPGDVIITGPVDGGPGHAIIVGSRRNTMWQASGVCGVHYTGLSLPDQAQMHAVFRFRDRGLWLC